MKKEFLKSIIIVILTSLFNIPLLEAANGNLIPNGSFEDGPAPTQYYDHFAILNNQNWPTVSSWTTGYTRNQYTFGNTSIFYGSAPATNYTHAQNVRLFDYSASSNCAYNGAPNFISSPGSNIQPQEGNRFIYLQGGYNNLSNQPNFNINQGGSIMTAFENHSFTCTNDEYELTFWVKAPEAAIALCPYNPSSTWNTNIHSNNKVEVVLRVSGSPLTQSIIFTTPQINAGPWTKYTATFPASTFIGFDRIEFRMHNSGILSNDNKHVIIDNIGLVNKGPVSHAVSSASYTGTCGDIVDLTSILAACGSSEAWFYNGELIDPNVELKGDITYTRVCYDANGCFVSETVVTITVNPIPTQYATISICEAGLVAPPNTCSQVGAESWHWDFGFYTEISQNPDGSVYIGQSGTYPVTTYYENGCVCTTIVTINWVNTIGLSVNLDLCYGQNQFFDPFPVKDPGDYIIWDDNPNATEETRMYIGLTTSFTTTAKLYNSNGCLKMIYTYNVNVSDPAIVFSESVPVLCGCAELAAQPCLPNTTSSSWAHDPLANATTTVCPQQDETYTYSCYDANGCILNQTVYNTYIEDDPIDIIKIINVCAPDCERLDPFSLSGVTISGEGSAIWSTGESSKTKYLCITPTSPSQSITVELYDDGCHKYNVTYYILPNTPSNYSETTLSETTVPCGECINITSHKCPAPSTTVWPDGTTVDPMTGQAIYCPKSNETFQIKCIGSGQSCPSTVINIPVTGNNAPLTAPGEESNIYWLCSGESFVPTPGCPGMPANAIYEWNYFPYGTITKPEEIIVVSNTLTLPTQPGAITSSPNYSGGFFTLRIYDEYGCLVCDRRYNVRWVENGPIEENFPDKLDSYEICNGGCVTLWTYSKYSTNAANLTSCSWEDENGVDVSSHVTYDAFSDQFTVCPPSGSLPITYVYTCSNGICDIVEHTITLTEKPCKKGATTSTSDIDEISNNVSIYPNPSTGVFTLDIKGLSLAETSYTIIDVLGREVMTVDNIESEKSIINMTTLDKGIYFIRLSNKDVIITRKIVVE